MKNISCKIWSHNHDIVNVIEAKRFQVSSSNLAQTFFGPFCRTLLILEEISNKNAVFMAKNLEILAPFVKSVFVAETPAHFF